MPAEIHAFRCNEDNLGALIRDPASGAVAAIDVPDADAVLSAAREKGWRITDILVTHEHGDHVRGIPAVKAATGARVAGSAIAARAAPLDRVLEDGGTVEVGRLAARVHAAPGHAAGHLVFHFEEEAAAFVGDVLFVMGCGRVLAPGTPEELWRSLGIVTGLPDATRLFGGHDYTLANARFARHVDPDNEAVRARLAEAEAAGAEGRFWADTCMAAERATNPFLRAGEPALARAAGLRPGADPGAVFARLREMKNRF